jgi:hypothetical protein
LPEVLVAPLRHFCWGNRQENKMIFQLSFSAPAISGAGLVVHKRTHRLAQTFSADKEARDMQSLQVYKA